jgi:hypothetical protein
MQLAVDAFSSCSTNSRPNIETPQGNAHEHLRTTRRLDRRPL